MDENQAQPPQVDNNRKFFFVIGAVFVLVVIVGAFFFVKNFYLNNTSAKKFSALDYNKEKFASNFNLLDKANYQEAITGFEDLKKETVNQGAKLQIDIYIAAALYGSGNREESANRYLSVINTTPSPTQKVGVMQEVLDYYYAHQDKEFLTQYIFTREPFAELAKKATERVPKNSDQVKYAEDLLTATLEEILIYEESLSKNSFVQSRLARTIFAKAEQTVNVAEKEELSRQARVMQEKAETNIAATSAMGYPRMRIVSLHVLNGVTRYIFGDFKEAETNFKNAMTFADGYKNTERSVYEMDLLARYQYALMLSHESFSTAKKAEIEEILVPFTIPSDFYKNENIHLGLFGVMKRASVFDGSNANKHKDFMRLYKVSPIFKTIVKSKGIEVK